MGCIQPSENGITNENVVVALGEACDSCWEIGVDILRYPSYTEFQIAHEKSDTVKAQADQFRERIQQTKEKDTLNGQKDISAVATNAAVSVFVDHAFTGVKESQIKTDLDVPRIMKASLSDVPQVMLPNFMSPALLEKWILFKPGDEGETANAAKVTIRAAYTLNKKDFTWSGKSLFNQHSAYSWPEPT